jgi:hypothetical protein
VIDEDIKRRRRREVEESTRKLTEGTGRKLGKPHFIGANKRREGVR